MNGNIQLSAPGGRGGDIFLDVRGTSLASYTILGRVVANDGSPQSGLIITIFERRSLIDDVVLATGTTDARGGYGVSFSRPSMSEAWDVFVRAHDTVTDESVDSPLLSNLEAGSHTVDLVLGSGAYRGQTEWERVAAAVQPLLGSTAVKDVAADRLEWLAVRADVFPTHLAFYIQAHRLSHGRSVQATTCYAFVRAGLPADLPGILRASEGAWEAALRNAWARRIIPVPGTGTPSELDTEVEQEIEAMRELVVEAAVAETTSLNHRSFFDTVNLSVADQSTFMQLWHARTGTLADFWDDVETTLTGGAAKAQLFQFAIQGAALVGYHPATLEALAAERVDLNIGSIADTAAWGAADWEAMLTTRSVTPPDDVPGADLTAKRQYYAKVLERTIEDAYPTLSLRHRISADEGQTSAPPNTTHVVDFLTANANFDILGTNIDRWVADNPTAFSGTSNPTEARANLETVQRVYRLTPRLGRYGTTKALLEQGIRSAADVANYTRDEFVSELSQHFSSDHHDPEALAGRVWDRSVRIHGSTQAMASYLGLAKTGAEFQPLAGLGQWDFATAGNGLGGLADILGNLDYCACKQCRSVLSPAAYLADLLHFLDKRPTELGNALTVLRQRRPDLEHILLDCANTNTVLPYIDLVNELLERLFADDLDGSSYQTTWSSEELRLHPEHLDSAVYEGTVVGLAKQITELVHPWVLPFHLPELEARQMLAQLGVPRYRLMQLLVDDDAIPVTPSAAAITAEALGMSLVEHSIIAGTYTGNASSDDREFWGYAAGAGTDGWVSILNGFDGSIRELLRRGDYTLAQLEELISLTYIDPNHYIGTGIKINWAETCDLDDATISSLDAAALDRLHRFTRLARRTGIPNRMLNVLIEEVGGGVLDATFLAKLVDIQALQQRLGVAWDELATWWASRIDARYYDSGKPSLYHRAFLPAGATPPAGFSPSDARGDEIVGEQDPLVAITAAELPTLLAATRLSEADYDRLVGSSFADGNFSFANFTALFRAASLARAAGLSIADLVALRELSGINPFASPAQTLDFLDALDGVRGSGFTIAELDWLLRHVGSAELDDATIARTLVTLARGLTTIEAEVAQLADPDGNAVRTNLATIVSNITTATQIVDGTSTLSELDQGSFIDTQFVSFVDPALAKTKLVTGGGELTDIVERRTWVLQTFVGQRRKRALLVDTAAAAFQISAAVAEALLFELLHQPSTSDQLADTYASSFATEAEIAEGLLPSSHPDEFAGWLRLAKAATFARRHEISAAQLSWYSGHLSGAWLDLDALPLDDNDTDASFTAWNRLRQALELRVLFGDTELGHQELAEAANAHAALDRLAEHTGWAADELHYIADAVGWTSTSDFDDELALARLRSIGEAGERIGVGLDVLWTWVHGSMTMAKAAEIKAVARAKQGEDRWPAVATPIRDQLREHQRDALIAAVIATQPTLTSRDAIFEHLLIDVEMGHCMLTTRIVQANATVQMFVHRVLLQLEDDVKFSAGAARAWDWMKNYRVWEANRKVFLYPENWIEPELRRDKTPEFKQLEMTLLQDTLDDAKVERALASYLGGLDRVANLEIVAVYTNELDSLPGGPVWLLGRSQSPPRAWFLRKRDSGNNWGPWEELPFQIDSDNVVLFERRGRLLLFWLTVHDASKKQSQNDQNGQKATQLAITWTEHDERGWGQTAMSQRTKPLEALDHSRHDRFMLRAWLRSDAISLIVYRDNDEGDVSPRAEFHYDAVSRHVSLAGTDFNPDQFPEHLNEDSSLKQASWIGLQSDYRFEGQRFYKRRLNATADDDELPLAAMPEEDPPPDANTEFVQGDYSAVLFHLAPSSGYRTLLHQGDFWALEPKKRFSPVVYDDRRRKFLLEPNDGFEAPSDEGDTISVNLIGALDAKKYYKCPTQATLVFPRPTIRITQAQKRRDRVTTRSAWSQGVPGQHTLPGVDGIDTQQVAISNPQVVYSKAKQSMQATPNTNAATGNKVATPPGSVRVRMSPLYHPYAREMVETVALEGVNGLYRPAEDSDLFRQQSSADPMAESALDLNEDILSGKAPVECYDFDFTSPYAAYNWEVFYHVPMLIADKLAADQRWAEAQRWYHTMFDPIETVDLVGETTASKFWRIKPFFEQAQNLAKNQFQTMLGIGVSKAQQQAAIEAFEAQVAVWRENPFDPHAVARIRPGVYQRALLRNYFDNLIEWADHLFRQDTLESINEATILYVLVAQLLGPRPQEVPGPEGTAKSYAQLAADGLDAFSNTAQKLENWILVPTEPAETLGCSGVEPTPAWKREKVELRFWYFCYPPNPELLKYWDIIADRLWKIRHCQNIDGVERRLAIFQPPIDPALLVRATAAGVDLASVLGELDSGLPPYRFRSVYARAEGFCSELRSLASALLQAIEKRDAEALARLRSGHELTMLARVRDIRVRQVEEARENVDSLFTALANAQQRERYYFDLYNEGLNDYENAHLHEMNKAHAYTMASQAGRVLSSVLSMIPQIVVSFPPAAEWGGIHLGSAANALSDSLGMVSTHHSHRASVASIQGSNARREEDWLFQSVQARGEVNRLEQDIAVAEIRIAIAERELANHDLQVAQAKAADRFMRDKFTNTELYDWMISQLSTLYFQTYQVAFDLAKRAERAYRHELAIEGGTPIIKYGYWDSLRKGLLAGDNLGHDLKRLDLAYMDRDVREFELRKTISLAELDPVALRTLQETGECDLALKEALFDLDHPGHYLRRIKAIRLTIPAVVGPYTSLGARLELVDHRTRFDKTPGSYPEAPQGSDLRFRYGWGSGQAIATSTAVADGGLFNLDFRDERYLPFEYAGAISSWKLRLPDAVRQFDYRTISDVIVHVDYTAREGGEALRDAAEGALATEFAKISAANDLALLVVVQDAFPNAWETFLRVPTSGTTQTLTVPLALEHFPYYARRLGVEITKVSFVMLGEPSSPSITSFDLTFDREPANAGNTPETVNMAQENSLPFVKGSASPLPDVQPATWALVHTKLGSANALTDANGWLDRTKVTGLLMLVHYSLVTT